MLVLSYLERLASRLMMTSNDEAAVKAELSRLGHRLNFALGETLDEHFQFGSSTRGTSLPSPLTNRAEIDYMVVFRDRLYGPQTYVDCLRDFAHSAYGQSACHERSTTVTVRLDKHQLNLLPATKEGGIYRILGPQGLWVEASASDINLSLSERDSRTGFLIKPAIRLAKFWNARNSRVFAPYALEKQIVAHHYQHCFNLEDYLFNIIETLPQHGASVKDACVQRAKNCVRAVREYQQLGLTGPALSEVQRLFHE